MTAGLAVTTSKRVLPHEVARANAWAGELGVPYAPRRGRSLACLFEEEPYDSLIAVQQPQPLWRHRDGAEFVWHPNMAVGRLREMERGATDRLVAAAELQPGDRVLDATLGLGADAVVMSAAVGPSGEVVGVEASPVLALLARHGLATYAHKHEEPMRRVRVEQGSGEDWLERGPWDVVYFDPMFDRPLRDSPGLAGLRHLACERRLAAETVVGARALVRRAVVLKARRGDPLLQAVGAVVPEGSGRVVYAVLPAVGSGG